MKYGDSRNCSLHSRFVKHCDQVLRFEDLQKSFDDMCQTIGLPTHEIQMHNKTKGKPADYRSYYDDAARKTIETAFQDELDRYGYRF